MPKIDAEEIQRIVESRINMARASPADWIWETLAVLESRGLITWLGKRRCALPECGKEFKLTDSRKVYCSHAHACTATNQRTKALRENAAQEGQNHA